MPFLIPITLTGLGGIFAWRAGGSVGDAVGSQVTKYAIIGGVAFLAYKQFYKG